MTKEDNAIAEIRRFNRFYTRYIGVVNSSVLKTEFSLAEARVLYEVANRETPTATEVGKALGMDPAHVSRILRAHQRRGLIARERSQTDGRQALLRLTTKGRKTFGTLDTRSRDLVQGMLASLPPGGPARMIGAMRTIEELLGEGASERKGPRPFILRTHQPGDMGWVVARHGVLYTQEHGWDDTFEALVAEICAEFIKKFDPKKERCWIAEQDGENVGSIFLVKKTATVAKLRLLIVEPKARGSGIGRRLVTECVRHARQVGYKRMTLWTQSHLHAARKLYEEAGFTLTKSWAVHSWGKDMVSETWDLDL
jgi:DNA-binding MarR family transcriptional regulator/N-acetylglutamate synthase-like GNAT family acetyltransferase